MTQLENYILDNTNCGVVLLRRDGKVLFANQAAMALLALEADPAFQKASLADLGTIQPKGIWEQQVSRKEVLFTRGDHHARLIMSTDVKEKSIIVFLEEATPESVRALAQETVYPVLVSIIAGIGPEIRRRASAMAKSNIPVVISGESGTGKEVLARAIHLSSDRSSGPFAVVDCSSLPATLIESELFGYEPGTFTGALRGGKPGKFELADGGTIFLDEIGDIPLEIQPRLLRIMNDYQVVRLGGSKPKLVNIRMMAATNKDLKAMVKAGTFRQDLYYRLMGAEIVLLPLRERAEYFEELVQLFLQKHSRGRKYTISDQAMEAMRAHNWPGNIRELEKSIEYATAMKAGGSIEIADLPDSISKQGISPENLSLKESVLRYERQLIVKALERNGNNVTRTAKVLGLSRRGLQVKMAKLKVKTKAGSDS